MKAIGNSNGDRHVPKMCHSPKMKWLTRAQWDPVRILWIQKINVSSDQVPEISAGGAGQHQAQFRAQHIVGKSKHGESQLEHWGKWFRRKEKMIGIFPPAQGIIMALYKGTEETNGG